MRGGTVATRRLGLNELSDLQFADEGHFAEFKSKEVAPSKASIALSAFANAAGGELYLGLADQKPREWVGFANPEEANNFLQVFNDEFPLGEDVEYNFLSAEGKQGLVLQVQVQKTKGITYASNRIAYIRIGAQSLPVVDDDLERLKYSKGVLSFENHLVRDASSNEIVNSTITQEFLERVVPRAEPAPWLEKQRLVREGHPSVAGLLLFSEEPQIYLPKRSAVKIYRYKTDQAEGTREALAFDPIAIEGCTYRQIASSVDKTVAIVQDIKVLGPSGLERAKYPRDALHEIITNAVLHRDYSVADDIDVRIFDNRVEVESPGRLPGHITPANILSQQYARNPTLVRLVNKFPNAPNKDVGEGLNTAFEAMRKLSLKAPEITEGEHSVMVVVRHEPLASAEEIIMEFLETHGSIKNHEARKLCGLTSESATQKLFKRMIARNMIEHVPGTRRRGYSYRRSNAP